MGRARVATLARDAAQVGLSCAITSKGDGLREVLGGLASRRPTGLIVIEPGRDEARSWAMWVVEGRVCGLLGPGPLDEARAWVLEDCHRRGEPLSNAHDALDWPRGRTLVGDFVRERGFDLMLEADDPGTRVSLLSGTVEWTEHQLPRRHGVLLEHLLLESARQTDELPRLMATLGDLDRVPVRRVAPAETAAANVAELNALGLGSGDQPWDFVADPDMAAVDEWRDVERVWAQCDGASTIAQINAESMMCRFRGLAALCTLVRCGNVSLAVVGQSDAAFEGTQAEEDSLFPGLMDLAGRAAA